MKKRVVSSALAIFGLALTLPAYGEVPSFGSISGGEQSETAEDARIGRAFDPSSINSFEGKIADMGHSTVNGVVGITMHLIVDINGELIEVQLGPDWVIQSQGVTLQKGDNISILGSKVSIAGKPWIIAAKLRKGKEMLDLRSELGVPIWQDKNWVQSKEK